MKSQSSLFIGILFSILIFTGCEEDRMGPLLEYSNTPRELTNIEVENLPGGAKITYSLPNDQNLLYVLGTYNKNGEEEVVKSSVFKNHILIEGFADTTEHIVNLYTVDRSENRSQPVPTTIKPLKPNLFKVFETLSVTKELGGIDISFKNEMENEFTLFTMIRDSLTGKWVDYDRLYTRAKEWTNPVRGLKPVEQDFAIFFRDKWNNNSDTLVVTLKPLYEEEFDYSLFTNEALADDTYIPRYRDLSTIWLNNGWFQLDVSKYPGLENPQWFTVDMGQKYNFGRMRFYPRMGDNWLYASGAPKTFQIWGSNNATTNWDDWTLVGDFEVIKPSGLPIGELIQEDYDSAEAGWDFTFPESEEYYRYFRFKTITTWGSSVRLDIQYIRLWGIPED